AGFLGSHLADRFSDSGWRVCGIDNLSGATERNVPAGADLLAADCCDRGSYAHLLSGADLVYHCASAAYDGLSIFSPSFVFKNTAQATVDLATASISAGAGRFVHCSSMARYGALAPPFTEDMKPDPVTPYGLAKPEQGTDDPSLVKKIYAICNEAHRWRCHTVANGWFFKCPQSYMIPKGMSLGPGATYRNGIKIDDSPEFRDRLLSYLTSPEPLPACHNCLGSAGKWFEHQQVRREEFRPAQCHTTEDLIHPRLVGTTRLALARVESLLPRTVVDTAEHVMRSSDPLIGLLRKVQAFNISRFRG
ncbi:MAG TPA: NAD-dependent epimerase/dehydratase family protein, partial [Streptosporangiaceae bacterium]